MKKYLCLGILGVWIASFSLTRPCASQIMEKERASDQRVKQFLDKMKNQWSDFNVPEKDGKILFEIILQNKYKRALEIGTSTGHSAIWIAWALRKTGGKLITIEIDEGRYRKALANFKETGLDRYIDARLADAHNLVNELSGPFDFVFIDADKEWYTQYAKVLIPILEPGGCIAAHNVEKGRFGMRGTREYYEYMRSLPEFATSLHPQSAAGMAISYKRRTNQ